MKKQFTHNELSNIIKESIMDTMRNMSNLTGYNPGNGENVNWDEFEEKSINIYRALQEYSNYLSGIEDASEVSDDYRGFVNRADSKHMWTRNDEDWNVEDKDYFIKDLRETASNIQSLLSSMQEMIDYNPFKS